MALIIALGSNLGDRFAHLADARRLLGERFELVRASRIYRSAPVDYLAQPDFYNQAIQFELPQDPPRSVLATLLEIERCLGRERQILRGPRCIDLDLIFWGLEKIDSLELMVPHPRWSERSFVVKPLSELPFFQTIEKCFTIPESFEVDAYPLDTH